MAIVIKEIRVCATIEKEKPSAGEVTRELIEQMRQMVEEEMRRTRLLREVGKRER